MNFWPFNLNRRETREGAYTDALIAQALAQATGSETVSAAATGAVETASGIGQPGIRSGRTERA